MKRAIPLFLLVIMLSAAGGLLHAQDVPSVKSVVDRTKLIVGEPLRFGVDVVAPAGTTFALPVLDSVEHFEFLAKPKVDSLTEGVNIHYRMEWKLTSFDSGMFKIPSLAAHIGSKDYRSDSISISVTYGNADSLKEYHDIRGIIDIANPAVKFIPWVLAGLSLLALVAIWFFGAREGRSVVASFVEKGKSKTLRPAYDEAMGALDELRKMPLPDPAAVKKYYVSMNDVLRVYLNRSQGLQSMEKTNEEMILHLSRLDLDRTAFTRLASLLRLVDFVKFAKYVPDPPEQVRSLDNMRDAIRLINEIRK